MDASFYKWKIGKVNCLSIYPYAGKIRNLIYQFKGCGDIELAKTFIPYLEPFLKIRFRGYCIVPAPSSKSRDEIRGFNQVEEIAKRLGMPILNCLEKEGDSKQSSLNKEERKKVGKFIHLKKGWRIKGKKVLLMDDVYTTGSTIKACIKRLEGGGAKKIEVLAIAKTMK